MAGPKAQPALSKPGSQVGWLGQGPAIHFDYSATVPLFLSNIFNIPKSISVVHLGTTAREKNLAANSSSNDLGYQPKMKMCSPAREPGPTLVPGVLGMKTFLNN